MNIKDRARKWADVEVIGEHFSKYLLGNCTFAEASAESIDALLDELEQCTTTELDFGEKKEKLEMINAIVESADRKVISGEDPELILEELIGKIREITKPEKSSG